MSVSSDNAASLDAASLADTDVVCALGQPLEEMVRIDELCRAQGTKFFGGAVYGMHGFFFTDLRDHDYIE